MIIDMPLTDTRKVLQKLVSLSHQGLYSGARVLTLLIHIFDELELEPTLEIIRPVARKFPCRVIVVISSSEDADNRLDAQIRYGGKVGVSELVLFKLSGPLTHHGDSVVAPFLLPDIPIFAFWPGIGPENPAADPIGSLASRRITDAGQTVEPREMLAVRLKNYTPGDTDLSWTKISYLRALLTATISLPPHNDLTDAVISGPSEDAAIDLFAGWIHGQTGIPVTRTITDSFHATINRVGSETTLSLDNNGDTISVSSHGYLHDSIAIVDRDETDFLSAELRSLGPDGIYEKALRGMSGVKFAHKSS